MTLTNKSKDEINDKSSMTDEQIEDTLTLMKAEIEAADKFSKDQTIKNTK
ncbi:MAG: hypothetical protein LKF81_11195 [Prevotella sp.]|jgi:hypothetical protein|nr:hypothetical protein [Prevotella sp.]